MVEGFFRKYGGDKLQVFSAGIQADGLNPRTIQVMNEVGIDISSHTSDLIDKYLTQDFYMTITVCDHAKEHCPVFTGKVDQRLHFGFPDPANATGNEQEIMAVYRNVRDKIDEFCKEFLEENI